MTHNIYSHSTYIFLRPYKSLRHLACEWHILRLFCRSTWQIKSAYSRTEAYVWKKLCTVMTLFEAEHAAASA